MMKNHAGLLSIMMVIGLHAGKTQSSSAWVQTLSGPGLGVVQRIAVDSASNDVFVAGVFEQEASFGGMLMQSAGGKDAFIAKNNHEGTLLWSMGLHGSQDEEVSALATDQQGNAYLGGSFWEHMTFGSYSLTAPNGGRALFLAKITPTGQLLWVQTFEGSSIKNISDIVADASGHIYMGGYFGGSLSIGSFQIQALGDTDLFLAAFNAQGQALWAIRAGKTGDTRITALALAPGPQLLITGGFFNLITTIGDTTLTANTYDRDVFLAAFDLNGQAQWVRKAGGVHDNELTDIAVADGNLIYACGYLVGVMNLGNNIAIQSSNGNPDFFLLKYNHMGTPLAARALGGLQADQAVSLTTLGQYPYVAGFFKGTMTIDGRNISAPGQNNAGFIAAFNGLLQNQELDALTAASGQVFLNQIAATGNMSGYYLAGSFQGSLQWGNQVLSGTGNYDGFAGKINTTVTDVHNTPNKTFSIRVFPQPASKTVFIQSERSLTEVRLFNLTGELLLHSKNTSRLSIEHLPAGEYVLFGVFENGEMSVTTLVIVH